MTNERVYHVRGGGEIVVRGSVPEGLLRRLESIVERGTQVVVVPCEGEMRSVLFALGRLSSSYERLRGFRLRLEGEEKEALSEYEQFIEETYESARKLDKRFSKLSEKVRKRLRRRGATGGAAAQSQSDGGEHGDDDGDAVEIEEV